MDARRLCLIIPPSPFLLDERVFPFLGILLIAAVLEREGWSVEVLDLSGYSNFTDAVKDHVRASKASAFGITATTPQMPAASDIAAAIKEVRREAKVILGGPHATLIVASLRRERKEKRAGRAHHAYNQLQERFDVIVAGDGEEAIFEALRADAPKLVDVDDRHSPLWQTSAKLNER